MKRVAIVTIESLNYGNRLQNYALQQVIEQLGYTVETLHRNDAYRTIPVVKRYIQDILQTKAAKFREFDSHINFVNLIVGRDTYPNNLSDNYDYFIVGSDQVWNPYYDFVAGKCDFLMFARDSQKISYAASFGVNEIPSERKVEYTDYLKTFKAISVREKQGTKIVEELTDRIATVVLDPVLLLDETEWKKVEKKPFCCPKKKYVFVYALGNRTAQFERKIEQLKEKYEIYDVRAIQKNRKERPIGPSEFLYLIRQAEEILTDSFHATVLSIIYHKKFITFNRPGLNMNSRIESLAELVGVKNQLTECGDLDAEAEIDYTHINTLLVFERKKSIEFLKKALNN